MKKIYKAILLAITLTLLFTITAAAQSEVPELKIRLSKDFGYGGFNNDIQGTFSIHVSGPDDLVEVHFYLDDTLLGTDKEAKFALQFQTDNYEFGWHEIYAIGILADGTEVRSNEVRREFVSGEDTMKFVVPVIIAVLAISLIGVAVPMWMGKGGGSVSIGDYGAAGGAVCKRCEFPFKRSIFSPNMIVGKLTRCPHCGKVAISRRAYPAELASAEERYLSAQQEPGTITEETREDSLRRSLEDSRFDD
ncbi:MAG: Ig-like domain-containing protein [Chloroflexota bacterium]